ncbi:4-hydroxythreonine-4-phosphate dehydrogenase [Phenylobacterium sp. Root77]|uniref:4-hydroxythreonine-4-phosphate dehydrogenase PdxA n=1 Tax=unclassified Phenylobacterium TaxID=2640670 RepID=UPI0006F7066E|nr:MULTISPECIES: 4-hydroxythreonine-4-phosphate dehydrogenase PdxA [unclassified Phenylobacterium]KQW72291.1 4-hydroxythreonine-4-phosphate dehydrogenase [Phenylobacterium sp. Root1277]KQW95944.1 4-hydroxythreonine-4-phosphate dehydrogenase [Phenylobacterium sp. Root1290]KRC44903.1 4-hydroxythreonine-4-phosphate dehydrogenase [Phenylobacterium sp. Root77]
MAPDQPPLALTLGDPAGVGPEIIVKAWNLLRASGPAFVVVGDFQALASASGSSMRTVRRVTTTKEAVAVFADALPVLDIPLRSPVIAGQPSSTAAPAIIRWIETAVGLALSGAVSGLVTAPIAKAPLYEAGFGFPGHTEFLGELTAAANYQGARGPIMMLAVEGLRTTLVTVHEPLSKVGASLSVDKIVNAGLVTAQALRRDFGIAEPRLAVAGFNPHAGEDGTIGREDAEIIAPAVAALRAQGVAATGPTPADSLFHEAARARFDAAVCMYHDQALIPVKMLDFWGGVNVTLGLPIVRTSPDHGTAFDIAGRGLARPDSLIAAIRMAGEIAARRV